MGGDLRTPVDLFLTVSSIVSLIGSYNMTVKLDSQVRPQTEVVSSNLDVDASAALPTATPADLKNPVAPPSPASLGVPSEVVAQRLQGQTTPITMSHPRLAELRQDMIDAGLIEADGRLTRLGIDIFTRKHPTTGWEQQWDRDWQVLAPHVEKALSLYTEMLNSGDIAPIGTNDLGPFTALLAMAVNRAYSNPEIQTAGMRPPITMDRFGTINSEGWLNHMDYFEFHRFASGALYSPPSGSSSRALGLIGFFSPYATRYGVTNLMTDVRDNSATIGAPTATLLMNLLFDRSGSYPRPAQR